MADAHISRGDRVWVMDDLSSGRLENVPAAAEFVEMDIADPRAARLIRDVGFDLVNHHAAQIDVRVSVDDPVADARVNIAGFLKSRSRACFRNPARRVRLQRRRGVRQPEKYPTPESAPSNRVPLRRIQLAGNAT